MLDSEYVWFNFLRSYYLLHWQGSNWINNIKLVIDTSFNEDDINNDNDSEYASESEDYKYLLY